jgi:hypothetical protein
VRTINVIERPSDLTAATIDIRGHAPVPLTSPDGRVSHFPRAWATVTTADGRTGVGWLEWNRNQPAEQPNRHERPCLHVDTPRNTGILRTLAAG